MADLMLAKPDADSRVLLTRQIKDAQAPEIAQMTGWLGAWGFTVMPMDSGMDHSGMSRGGMGGMMSETDMKELEEASGADASRLFLEGMGQHHEGAVEMALADYVRLVDPAALLAVPQTPRSCPRAECWWWAPASPERRSLRTCT